MQKNSKIMKAVLLSVIALAIVAGLYFLSLYNNILSHLLNRIYFNLFWGMPFYFSNKYNLSCQEFIYGAACNRISYKLGFGFSKYHFLSGFKFI